MVYRITKRKIDVLTVEQIGPALRRKWGVPPGTVTIEAACYLPFVPSLEVAEFICGRTSGFIPASHLDCHVRLGLRRQINQREIKPKNLWFLDGPTVPSKPIVDDMIRAVQDEVLKFFSLLENLSKFLEYLRIGEDNFGRVGMWNIGRVGSFRRLYLTGFTALEAEEWSMAKAYLNSCSDIVQTKKLNISSNVMACIKRAALLATEQRKMI